MAILCKQQQQELSRSNKCSIARIKQRDYTIPVRLNRLLLPPSASIAHTNQLQPQMLKVTANQILRTTITDKTVSNQKSNLIMRVNYRNNNNNHHHHYYKQQQQSYEKSKLNRMINPMISMKEATRKRRSNGNRFSSSSSVLLIALAAVVCAINTNICHCDTKQILHSASSSSSASPSATSDFKINSNTVITPTASHKETLLSALSDNIERQHFKIKPARALIQQRPSKFDSADYLADLNLDAGIDFIKKKAPALVSIKKVDDSMRQILRMHENSAAAAAAVSSQNHKSLVGQKYASKDGTKSSSLVATLSGGEQPEKEQQSSVAVKRWRKLTRSPNLVNSLNHNKVVSKALAYVTPLVSSKLSDSSILSQSFMLKNSSSSLYEQASDYYHNGLPKIISLHPFAGRSNKQQASFTKSLISFRPPSNNYNTKYTATTQPQTSSLVRPLNYGDKQYQHSTPLSTGYNKNRNFNNRDSSSKTSGSSNSVDSIISDLMADSSDSSIGATIEAASAGISSHLGHFSSSSGSSSLSPLDKISSIKQSAVDSTSSSTSTSDSTLTDSSASSSAVAAPTTTNMISHKQHQNQNQQQQYPHKSAGSRLKKGANQLAQNYLHNLITLSQLPILASPIHTSSMTSTAPSVLEKKRKPNKIDKIGNASGSKFRRRRLIEDIYRYAYLLSTGVRNKRDPLEALGSAPNPSALIASSSSSSSLLSSHNNQNRRKVGALSQRSINRLMASNYNQMLNYVRRLRSMLTTLGPMSKAKPRGVMWDMATDPSLAVTVFHLLERASVALPLGFLLLPIVRMIRHPMSGLDLGRILPAKASHRSVDIEELAKRLDIVDKMLSRALRSTHRESFIGK